MKVTTKSAWIILFFAGICEIIWALALPKTHGFTNLWWSLFFATFSLTSFWLFSLSLKKLPISTSYAIFTGMGTIGTVIIAVIFLGEEITWIKGISLAMIIGGIIGLKLTANKEDSSDNTEKEIKNQTKL